MTGRGAEWSQRHQMIRYSLVISQDRVRLWIMLKPGFEFGALVFIQCANRIGWDEIEQFPSFFAAIYFLSIRSTVTSFTHIN